MQAQGLPLRKWEIEVYFTCTELLLDSVLRSALHIGYTSSSSTY